MKTHEGNAAHATDLKGVQQPVDVANSGDVDAVQQPAGSQYKGVYAVHQPAPHASDVEAQQFGNVAHPHDIEAVRQPAIVYSDNPKRAESREGVGIQESATPRRFRVLCTAIVLLVAGLLAAMVANLRAMSSTPAPTASLFSGAEATCTLPTGTITPNEPACNDGGSGCTASTLAAVSEVACADSHMGTPDLTGATCAGGGGQFTGITTCTTVEQLVWSGDMQRPDHRARCRWRSWASPRRGRHKR